MVRAVQQTAAVRPLIASLLIVASTIADAAPRKSKPRARPTTNTVADARGPKPIPKDHVVTEPQTPKPGAWKTTVEVVLRKKPGERQAVVTKLPANTPIEIMREEGRWLLVRAGKHLGYLTRTTIVDTTPPPPPPIDPPTLPITELPTASAPSPARRWSSQRNDETRAGASGFFLGVTAASPLYGEPREGASKLGDAASGDRLAVIDASDPTWIQVRTTDGRAAWIARAAVDDGTARVALASTEPVVRQATRTAPPAATVTTRRFVVRVDAEVGYRSFGMDFSSNGTSGLANYVMSSEAAAASIEGDAVMRLSSKLTFAFDARVLAGTSAPGSGITYTGPSRVGGTIPFSTVAADAGVRIGTRARRMFDVALRGGIHYDAFIANDVANAGRLPRERLFGAVAGARVDIRPPRSRVTVGLRFDALVIGARGQTAGLEDGESSTAHATWAGATIRIPLARRWWILSVYDFGRATTEWTGMSVRTPGTTSARRVDSTQTVQLGIATEL